MAKGKSKSAGKLQSASSAKRKKPASKGDRSSPSATKATTTGPRDISHIEIGHIAGDVWSLLEKDGAQTLATIKKSVDAPADLVMAAIGWLSREDKVDFTTSGRAVKISLR